MTTDQRLTIAEESLAFSSSLLRSDNESFESHLLERSSQIKSRVSQIFLHAPTGAPQVVELQQRISEILSTEKLHAIELQKLVQEKDATSERLENAVSRYMIAEKKLDRAKSAQVAKLEAQATAASRPEPSSSTPARGEVEAEDGPVGAEVDRARKEAVALAEKRQQQLEILVKQNVRMENELAAMKAKFEALSDDDYAKSELFQTIKSQLDDTVKRVNDLEAQNIQLREEAKLLQSERTTYRDAADTEVREQTMDMQSQLAQGEQEVVRLRHARDEVKAELSTRLATMDQHTTSQAQLRQMIEAKDLRIQTLESETERLRQASQATSTNGVGIGEDELETQRRHAETERAALESEVRSMEAAYRKAQAVASRKVTEIVDWEDRLQRFSAEKAKADQKYFASMKNIEAKNAELRALKAQAARSTDMVSTLKEAESTSRLQVETLGKQVAEMKESLGTVTNQYRSVQNTINEQKALINRLEAHSNEFKKQVAAKVELVQAAEKAQRSAEGELEELKVRLGTTQKQVETLKKKGSGQQSEEFEMLRVSLAYILVSPGLLLTFVPRLSRNAMSATATGRTLCSRRAVMSAARSVSRSRSRFARGSALYAASSLGRRTTCESRCDYVGFLHAFSV